MTVDNGWVRASLIIVVAVKLFAHAIFLPAWEGPDEPFHMGRALPLHDGSSVRGERPLQPEIGGSVAAYPCAADLSRVFGCPPFDGTGAFNLLKAAPSGSWQGEAVLNYEAHQPPGYYLVIGSMLKLGQVDEPLMALLIVRLLSVALVISGLIIVMRTDATAFVLLSSLLLLPGAAESLARAANDSMVFLASAVVVFAAAKERKWLLLAGAVAAPLVKLTAAPVIAAVVLQAWLEGRRKLAAAVACASLAVLPLQAIRGWAWGGTVELNRDRLMIDEPLIESAIGLLRSLYTIAKTTIWLGNWSFFRPPFALLILIAIVGVATMVLCRPAGTRTSRTSLLGGLVVLAAGILAFSVAHRSLFGQWGGVGGWYIWGIMPWIATSLAQNVRVAEGHRRLLTLGFLAFLLVTNLLWLRSATNIYGLA